MAETAIEPRYLDYRSAEKYTGLDRTTLWRAVRRGELKVIKVGAAVRFDIRELDRFMASRVQDKS